MFQRLLEFLLTGILTADGVGGCLDNIAFMADLLPEPAVIERPPVGLSGGVIDVLDVSENCDTGHGFP